MGTTRIKVIDLSSDQKKKVTKVSEEKPEKKAETKPVAAPAVKPKAPTKVRTRGKKYREAAELIDKTQTYSAPKALELLRKVSTAKFDPTVEIHLNVADKNIRGKVSFPHSPGTKKEKKYLIFSEKKTDAKNVIWGDQNSIAQIEEGKLKPQRDFDAVITSPKFMPQLAKVAKILGPRGMMPNPKAGTITDDPEKILAKSDEDSYEFTCDPTAPIIHTKLGKLSYKDAQLSDNLKALVLAVGQTKIKKAVIKSTMSPAIKIDVASTT